MRQFPAPGRTMGESQYCLAVAGGSRQARASWEQMRKLRVLRSAPSLQLDLLGPVSNVGLRQAGWQLKATCFVSLAYCHRRSIIVSR